MSTIVDRRTEEEQLKAQTSTFGYDALGRLTSAVTAGTREWGAYDREYTYDAIGNLTAKAGVSYGYPASGPGSVRPHAVTSTSAGGSFSYDANGNACTERSRSVTSRLLATGGVTYTQAWDCDNRLEEVSFEGATQTITITFTYDANGVLLAKGTVTDTTVYVGGIYEKELTSGDERLYFFFGGQRIAVEEEGTLHYLAGDHLGTTSVVLSSAGALVAESRHYPYGEERWSSGTLPTDYRFTGQLLEADLSIYIMGARWYDPFIARWLSADTVVPNPARTQSFNRYTYVRGNPVGSLDVSGHARFGGDDYDEADELVGQYKLLALSSLLTLVPQDAVDYIVSYIEDEFSISPAPGVAVKYEQANPNSGLVLAWNHNAGDKDNLIEVFPDAFVNAGNAADLTGTVFHEIYHSQQEAEVEALSGQDIWTRPAPCIGTCPDEWDQTEGMRLLPGSEIEAIDAELALPLQYSPGYKDGLTVLRDRSSAMRQGNWRYYYPPGTRLVPAAPTYLPLVIPE